MYKPTMKSLIVFFLVVSGGSWVHAKSSYCDNVSRLDQLPNLTPDQFDRYLNSRKKADSIIVSKDRKRLYLLNQNVILKSYVIAMGYNFLAGPKHFEGDNKTPEGVYSIDKKNPQSSYYLALHISYPNTADVAYARARGKSPGGDIMIHGFPKSPSFRQMVEDVHPGNWTTGCIAVTDHEVWEIYRLVNEGTRIEICKPTPHSAITMTELD